MSKLKQASVARANTARGVAINGEGCPWSRKQWPNSSQPSSNKFEILPINDMMTESNLAPFVVFVRVHHLPHREGVGRSTEESKCSVKQPARGELGQHIPIHRDVVYG